jgi:hypothetical protein
MANRAQESGPFKIEKTGSERGQAPFLEEVFLVFFSLICIPFFSMTRVNRKFENVKMRKETKNPIAWIFEKRIT